MIVSGDSLKCSDINSFNSLLSENSIKFIDFLFSDFDGQLKKATYRANIVNECDIMNNLDIRLFNEEGVGNQLKLRPIFQSVYNDPFSSHNSLGIICETDDEYDSRNLLKSAIKYMNDNSIIDDIHMSLTFEFFIFDDVKCNINNTSSCYSVNSSKNRYDSNKFNNYKFYESGDKEKKRSLLANPNDDLYDLRCELCEVLQSFNIKAIKHNHGLSNGQCSIDIDIYSILEMADIIQKLKYAIRNVVSSYGKVVTFMAKPLPKESGSMLSFVSYLIDDNKKITGDYVENFWKGIKHNSVALSAFANSSINSYKRLYSLLNNIDCKKDIHLNKDLFIFDNDNINLSLADPMINPYQYFAAFIMAGVDGILNHKNSDNNFHIELSADFEYVLSTLKDADFLCKNKVFNSNYITKYIFTKSCLINEYKNCITAFEYMKYFLC